MHDMFFVAEIYHIISYHIIKASVIEITYQLWPRSPIMAIIICDLSLHKMYWLFWKNFNTKINSIILPLIGSFEI